MDSLPQSVEIAVFKDCSLDTVKVQPIATGFAHLSNIKRVDFCDNSMLKAEEGLF